MENAVANKNKSASAGVVISSAMQAFGEMVQSGAYQVPPNYSYVNAMQAARFQLTDDSNGKPLIATCDQKSIVAALIEMAQKGLNPAKNQCYFIKYGQKLTLSISYQGKILMAKRDGGIKDVHGYAIYEGEELKIGYNVNGGVYFIESYKPDPTKWSKDHIVGAVAVIINADGTPGYCEYMTMEQIRAAWQQGGAKGNSPAHKNFPDQMAIKTVKSRALKNIVNSTDDEEIFSSTDATDWQLAQEIKENANQKAFVPSESPALPGESAETTDPETGEIKEEELASFIPDGFEPIDEMKVPF